MNSIPMFAIKKDYSASPDKSFNRIFGPPSCISADKWPRNGAKFQHHLMTLELGKIMENPFKDYQYMSIFLPDLEAEDAPLSDSLTIKLFNENDTSPEPINLFPDKYQPWWKNNSGKEEKFRNGISFNLERNSELISFQKIKQINEGLSHICDLENEDEVIKYLDENSYLGGIPIWLNDREAPLDIKGNRLSFFLMLNGFEEVFISSFLEDFCFYLFYKDSSHFHWVIQR